LRAENSTRRRLRAAVIERYPCTAREREGPQFEPPSPQACRLARDPFRDPVPTLRDHAPGGRQRTQAHRAGKDRPM